MTTSTMEEPHDTGTEADDSLAADEDFDRMIANVRDQMDTLALDDPARLTDTAVCAYALFEKYSRGEGLSNLTDAITAMQRTALNLANICQPDAQYKFQLGCYLYSRFEETSVAQDIDEAIALMLSALRSLTPKDNESTIQLDCLLYLGQAFYQRYHTAENIGRVPSPEDLDHTIKYASMALDIMPETHNQRLPAIRQLFEIHYTAFRAKEELSLLDSAIQYLQMLLKLEVDLEGMDRFYQLVNMSELLWIRFDSDPSADPPPDLLYESISKGKEAVAMKPHAADHNFLHNLAVRLGLKYKKSYVPSDLDESIRLDKLAIEQTPPGAPALSTYCFHLANRCVSKYHLTMVDSDLEEAILQTRRALCETPDGHIKRAEVLNNLGMVIFYRHEKQNSLVDLKESLRLGQEAVLLSPMGSSGRRKRLCNLIVRMLHRHSLELQENGIAVEARIDQQKLDAALESDLTMAEGNEALARSLGLQGYPLPIERRVVADAIFLARESLWATSTDDAAFASRNCLLGILLSKQARISDDLSDIEEAIGHWRRASKIDHRSAHYLSDALFSLSSMLLLKHSKADDEELTVLTEALRTAMDGWFSAAEDNPRRAEYAAHLDHIPGINPRNPSSKVRKHSCPNCKALLQYLETETEGRTKNKSSTTKRLAYDESSGKLVAVPFTANDFANAHGEVKTILSTSGTQSLETAITQDFHEVGSMQDSNARGVTFMDIKEIEDKAPLPEQAEFYGQKGSLSDLDMAISIQRFVVARTKITHPRSRQYLGSLSYWLHARYLLTKSAGDLDEAILYGNRAIERGPTPLEDHIDLLGNVAVLHKTRFEDSGLPADLNQTIKICQQALELLPTHSKDYSRFSVSLAYHLYSRFQRTLVANDLDHAIQLLSEVAITSEAEARLTYASNLIRWHQERYRVLGKKDDVSKAIEWGEATIDMAVDHPEYLPELSSALANAFLTKNESTCDLEDLDKAIQLGRKALDYPSPPRKPSVRSLWLSNLGMMVSNRVVWTNQIRDSEESVAICREAVAIDSESSPQYDLLLANLSHVLGIKYQLAGNIADLEEAIELAQRAIKVATDKNHERLASERHLGGQYGLDELGTLYFCRYQAIGARLDLDESIKIGLQSLENNEGLLHKGHLRKRQALNNLSSRFALRFSRYHDSKDLDKAFKYGLESLEGMPITGPDPTSAASLFAVWVSDAAVSLQDSKNLQYLIRLLETQIQRIPLSHKTKRAETLTSLGRMYFARFKAGGTSGMYGDLQYAISLASMALEEVPLRHVKRFEMLHLLGSMFHERHRFLQQPSSQSIERAAAYYLEAASVVGSPILFRILAGRDAALLYAEQNEWDVASKTFAGVLSLFPQLTSFSIGREDQEKILRSVTGLSSAATTAALRANKGAEYAFVQLEAGRGVISSLLINSRRDVSSLERENPVLYERYTALRARCAVSIGPPRAETAAFSKSTSEQITERQENLRELSILEARIRDFDGLNHFQHRLAAKDIAALASSGPLVSFNVNRWGSHALYMTSTGKSGYISLPELKIEDLEANAHSLIGKGKLSSGVPSSRPARNAQLRKILTWLWAVAVRPVLTALGLRSERADQRLPRIFWVANGLMGSVPLHAAGDFDGKTDENTAKYVVSTYVPTLESLAFARDLASRKKPSHQQPWLVVAVPETTGMRDLLTADEVTAIENVAEFSGVSPPTVLTNPSRAAILDALPNHSIVHFSCHGTSHPENPSDGGLHIEKGVFEPPVELKVGSGGLYFEQPPAVVTPDLSISDLTAISHQTAQLAYLSACSTAENAAEQLVDEVIHLASSFQLAGFAHVIGSLWETDDGASMAVASAFYKNLFNGLPAGQVWDDEAVAYALHDAVESLKEQGLPNARRKRNLRNDPLAWAPFVHVGI